MKKLAKILSALLCLAVVLSLASVAFAAGETYTKVTSLDELKAGGKFVIIGDDENGNYFAFNNTINEAEKLSTTPVTIDADGKLSGENIPVWSIAAEGDGFSINNGTIYLANEGSTSLLAYEGGNPYAWVITLRDNGCFLISNQEGKRSVAYRHTRDEVGAYAISNETSDTYGYEYNFNLTIYKLDGSVADVPAIPAPKVPVAYAQQLAELKTGDQVYMVLSSEGKAMTGELKKDRGQMKMVADDVKFSEDGKLEIYEDTAAALYTVTVNEDGTYSFSIDGKYLTADNTLDLVEELTEAGKWILEATEGGFFLKSAVVDEGKDAKYLEYYSRVFTTYKLNTDKAGIYTFSFYAVVEDEPVVPPTEPTVPETTVPETTIPETTAPEATEPVGPSGPSVTGDAFGIVVALMAVSGIALVALKKKEN